MIGIIASIAAFVGVFWLQVHLSRAEKRWPGLILPLLGVLLIVTILLSHAISIHSFPATAIGGADGPTSIFVSAHTVPWNAIALFGVYTSGLLLLYLAERNRKKRNRDMDKSRIQDL